MSVIYLWSIGLDSELSPSPIKVKQSRLLGLNLTLSSWASAPLK